MHSSGTDIEMRRVWLGLSPTPCIRSCSCVQSNLSAGSRNLQHLLLVVEENKKESCLRADSLFAPTIVQQKQGVGHTVVDTCERCRSGHFVSLQRNRAKAHELLQSTVMNKPNPSPRLAGLGSSLRAESHPSRILSLPCRSVRQGSPAAGRQPRLHPSFPS